MQRNVTFIEKSPHKNLLKIKRIEKLGTIFILKENKEVKHIVFVT